MYAIIAENGRQYRVEEGQELRIDYRDASQGDAVTFENVIAYSDGQALKFGAGALSGATVTGKVVGVAQGPKLTIQKFRRRKGYRRRTGHRQLYTTVLIDKIAVK